MRNVSRTDPQGPRYDFIQGASFVCAVRYQDYVWQQMRLYRSDSVMVYLGLNFEGD